MIVSESTVLDRAARTPATAIEVLRNAEHRRNRFYCAGELAFTLAAMVAMHFSGGDESLRRQLLGWGAAAIPGLVAAQVLLRRQAFNTLWGVALLKGPLAIAVMITLLYCGVITPFLVFIGAAAIYYGQSSSRALAIVPTAAIAITLPALLLAISLGALPDRSLFQADARPVGPQLAVIGLIETAILLAFIYGNDMRRSTTATVAALEAAIRDAGERQALLAEARLELDQALGGRGRFTGRRAGSWVLGKVLGRGGMGEVYAAHQPSTPMKAAVKLLLLDPVLGQQQLTRFRREADVLAKLECPNVVKLLEVGELGSGEPYFAMELLEGVDLSQHLRQQPRLPPGQVVTLVQDVANALEAARREGIVHRDLKPQNLFWESACHRWKVLDFGVSKLGQSGTLTEGLVLGTPGYMAPEQAAAQEVDHRADVFGLTAIAYRCLTGRPPFSGDDPARRLFEVLWVQPPRPSSISDVPTDFDLALVLGFAKRAEDRVATAVELARAIAEAAEGRLSSELRDRSLRLRELHDWGEVRETAV